MNVKISEKEKLEPLSRDDILRGFILTISIFLIFFSFSSDDRATGIFALLISILFLVLLFFKGPISVEPNYLFERYGDNFGFYLDNAESYLCKSFNAEKKSEKVLVGVAFNFLLVMLFVLPFDLLFLPPLPFCTKYFSLYSRNLSRTDINTENIDAIRTENTNRIP